MYTFLNMVEKFGFSVDVFIAIHINTHKITNFNPFHVLEQINNCTFWQPSLDLKLILLHLYIHNAHCQVFFQQNFFFSLNFISLHYNHLYTSFICEWYDKWNEVTEKKNENWYITFNINKCLTRVQNRFENKLKKPVTMFLIL